MDFTKNTDRYGRKVMMERTWTPENGNPAAVQLTADLHGNKFVMVSIPGLSLDTMVEWSHHGHDWDAAETSYQERVRWMDKAYGIVMRHPVFGTDMESRIFAPAGDLNGSTLTLWRGRQGWTLTVQFRSAHTGYTGSQLIPLYTDLTEEDAREAFRMSVLERDGSYQAEAQRLAK